MQAKFVSSYTAKDVELFKRLDKHSSTLRHSADDLADFLIDQENKNKTTAMRKLIDALQQLKICPIVQIDVVIQKVKEELFRVSITIENNCLYTMQHESKIELMRKQAIFSKEVIVLVNKALTLNRGDTIE